MAKTEKTLEELINGHIVDTIYLPNDPQAEYDLSKLLNNDIPTNVDTYEDKVEELKEQIKSTSEKLTLRFVPIDERQKMLEDIQKYQAENELADSDVLPFEERIETKLFLYSLVSVEVLGEVIGVYDKSTKHWVNYLKDMQTKRPQSFVRLINKINDIAVSADAEKKILESIDFLS